MNLHTWVTCWEQMRAVYLPISRHREAAYAETHLYRLLLVILKDIEHCLDIGKKSQISIP